VQAQQAEARHQVLHCAQRAEKPAPKHRHHDGAQDEDTDGDSRNQTEGAVTEAGKEDVERVITSQDQLAGAIRQNQHEDGERIAEQPQPPVGVQRQHHAT
jgi:hypothetical protein